MFWSSYYLALRCVFQLVSLRPRSEDFKELEIVVLRHGVGFAIGHLVTALAG